MGSLSDEVAQDIKLEVVYHVQAQDSLREIALNLQGH